MTMTASTASATSLKRDAAPANPPPAETPLMGYSIPLPTRAHAP
jgi:hypothetical protein